MSIRGLSQSAIDELFEMHGEQERFIMDVLRHVGQRRSEGATLKDLHTEFGISKERLRRLLGVSVSKDRKVEAQVKNVGRADQKAAKQLKGQPCVLCGRVLKYVKALNVARKAHPVVALDDGKEITVYACSEKCRQKAWKSYEEKRGWLQQQLMQVRNSRQVLTALQEHCRKVSKSHREASKPATSSPC